MENQKQTSFTFEIDNISEKKTPIISPNFLSGGCEWFVLVYPKGYMVDDHLSLFLNVNVANPKSLRLGWKRLATFSFVLLNQSGKELFRGDELCELFCAQFTGIGFANDFPLEELQEKGFLEKNKLIVKVEVKVVEVADEGDATGNETLDYYGFQILHSQVCSVAEIFFEHPDFAVNVRQKNQRVKTTYMNILLELIETLNKPPHSISETELNKARSDLIDLTEAGFMLNWLKVKLDEVSLERKKANAADGSRVQELEEHIKNLKVELSEEKIKTATVSDLKDELNKEMGNSAAKVLSLEQTVSDLKDELNKEKRESAARVLSLEQTVSNLEEEVWVREDEVSGLEDELNKEKGKFDTCAAKMLSLEQTVSDLEDELNKKKRESDLSADNVLSLGQTVSDLQDEVSVLNDEVLDLKDELNKKKHESDSSAAKVLLLEQTVSDLEDELNKNEAKSATCAAKVLSLEQTVLNLKDELNKNEAESATCAAELLSLEQTVLHLRAELKKEKGVVSSWEVLGYEDLYNEK